MNFSLSSLRDIVEIMTPVIFTVAWFIRLESKVARHGERLRDTDKKLTETVTKSDNDRELLQQMALNVQEIKTNMEWVIPLLKEKMKE